MNSRFSSGWQRCLSALGVALFCIYVPFSWLLLIDYPWNSNRWLWLKLWPILPGFIPGAVLFHPRAFLEFTAMGVTTVLLIAVLTYIGTRTRVGLAGTALLGLLVAIPSAYVSYGAFRF